MNFKELQKKAKAWTDRNFPTAQPWEPLVGAVEEIGELAHAHLKAHQGIRTNENHALGKVDAVGDIIIYLCHYCSLSGIDLQKAVDDTWAEVEKRDWKKNKVDAKDD